ncbi:GDSL-type esterase/lipase family protein (plasmid) [Rhizobium sullae]|uniref:GDSL-type esterase/lipase family protein n=1 Tax=Rhizobium sullae TaxID=50338 RepID=A0ABY5XR08_RHISU|nr:GDSL-type esterase/lipase family protein [Rhizobium sullae]UWU17039.1 GDSL-type esterase/lipase family protein [Rhizobium sullae]
MAESAIVGGSGPDVFYDDNRRNTFDGGGGVDTASYSRSSHGVIADLESGHAYKLLAILPFGDSITYGVIGSTTNTESGGYRKFMLDRLHALNVQIDLVGSLSNGPADMEDRDHEGHRNWTLNQLNSIDASVLAATRPDAVLLIAGTNDSSTDSVQTMLQDLRDLLLSLTSQNSSSTVFVGSLPPVRVGQQSQERADRVDAYNDAMPELIEELAAQGRKVVFVDMRGLTPDDITAPPQDSGLHPTAGGYEKIASYWLDALEQHFGLSETGIGTDRDSFISIENLTGSSFVDQLSGDGGANTLDGLGGDDLLQGRGGGDVLIGGTGADTLIGGAGDDVYYVDNSGDKTTEEAGGGADEVHAYLNWTLADHVENLFLRSAANLAGAGNASANRIIGNSGANRIDGLGGGDTLDGRGGADRIIGGAANDILTGGAGDDRFVYAIGDGHDVITDFDLSGNDTLEIAGYQSYSELRQVGADTLVVFSSSDTLLLKGVDSTFMSAQDFIWVSPADADQLPPGAIVGDSGDNTLKGSSGADHIDGMGGTDVLDGKAGADRLVGGTGNDGYYVENIDDQTIEQPDGGIDETHAYLNWTLTDNIESLFLRSSANLNGQGNALANTINGNSGANRLEGGGGNDMLDGRGGNDRLVGGMGGDILTGGSGGDIFVFSAGDGRDAITDFNTAGDDLVEISGYLAYEELRQLEDDTLVVLSDSDSLLLKAVIASNLSVGDFLFA